MVENLVGATKQCCYRARKLALTCSDALREVVHLNRSMFAQLAQRLCSLHGCIINAGEHLHHDKNRFLPHTADIAIDLIKSQLLAASSLRHYICVWIQVLVTHITAEASDTLQSCHQVAVQQSIADHQCMQSQKCHAVYKYKNAGEMIASVHCSVVMLRGSPCVYFLD